MPFMDSNTPLKHRCENGTVFTAERADLRGGVKFETLHDLDATSLAADFFQFGAWHAATVHPRLNGFQGYDCVKFSQRT